MGYVICAFVAKIPALETIATPYQNAFVVPLQQGFGLIPITEACFDEIQFQGEPSQFIEHEDSAQHRFYYLTARLTEIGAAASHFTPVAYIEANYFGGYGVQGAMAWDKGEVIFEPSFSEIMKAISPALRRLGVAKGASLDEFDALGLGKHRDLEDWLTELGT